MCYFVSYRLTNLLPVVITSFAFHILVLIRPMTHDLKHLLRRVVFSHLYSYRINTGLYSGGRGQVRSPLHPLQLTLQVQPYRSSTLRYCVHSISE